MSSSAILMVDHSNLVRSMIRKSLTSTGIKNILEAVDGKEALDLLMEYPVDLIISAIHMPKVNGIELLRALKNHSSLQTIPFIVLTSDTENETFKEFMATGAADFIKKPFTKDELISKIKPFSESI